MGHPKFFVVDNSQNGFNEKINRIYNIVMNILDMPLGDIKKRKFLLKKCSIPADLKVEIFNFEVTFLKSEEKKERKLKKRTQNGMNLYFYSEKLIDGKKTQRKIDFKNYLILKDEENHDRNSIFKQRKAFLWEHQLFVLDEFEFPKKTLLLKIDGIEKDWTIKIPDFCLIEKEV